jgi:hypothetical protein
MCAALTKFMIIMQMKCELVKIFLKTGKCSTLYYVHTANLYCMNKYDSDLVRLNFLIFVIKLTNVASLSSMWKRLLYKMND